jgi:hypothetical protein
MQSCSIAATPVWTQERRRSRAMRPLKHDPAKPHCFLTQCSLNPDVSHTNVSEETQLVIVSECMLRHNGTRTSQTAKPFPNPDDAGPIVHRLMGIPVDCDTAQDQTQVCRDTSSTAMQDTIVQCLRPLCHSGGPVKGNLKAIAYNDILGDSMLPTL